MADSARDVVILGAGVTGLTAAYELSKKGFRVVVLEKEKTPGGLLKSVDRGNYSIESFYHHVFRNDHDVFSLLRELGLSNKLVWRSTTTGFFSPQHGLMSLSGPLDLPLYRDFSAADKVRFLIGTAQTVFFSNPRALDGVSAKDWLRSVYGERVFEKYFSPLLQHKYPDAEPSAAWFVERAKLRGKRGLKGETLGYLYGGFDQFVRKLVERITSSGGEVQCGVEPSLSLDSGLVSVSAGSKSFKVNAIVSTIPPAALAKATSLDLSAYSQLRYQGAISIVFGLSEKISDKYWVNMLDKASPFGALVEHTNFMSLEDYGERVAYMASYPAYSNPVWAKDDASVFELYFAALKRMFPHIERKAVSWYEVVRAPAAGLVYDAGFLSRLPASFTPAPNVFMGGVFTSYPERSINSSVQIGQSLAAKCDAYLSSL